MRIISGKYKGKRIFSPGGNTLRPTGDRVKEAIFSTLESMDAIRDRKVLDLFAGTGALGLEALSRGAKSVVFVESNKLHLRAVSEFARAVDAEKDVRFICGDVFSFIENDDNSCFGLIFADPPYEKCFGEKVITKLVNSRLVSDDTFVVYESSAREKLPECINISSKVSANLLKNRKYGDTLISYFGVSVNE